MSQMTRFSFIFVIAALILDFLRAMSWFQFCLVGMLLKWKVLVARFLLVSYTLSRDG